MSSADEILDVVDENDRVVGRARRGDAYARGLRHRCVFVWARDPEGRVFVHRRTATKLVFPGCALFIGGVVERARSWRAGALPSGGAAGGRGSRCRRSSSCRADDGPGEREDRRCRGAGDGGVLPQVEEVAWYGFLPEAELEGRLGEWEFVPDGLSAYARLRSWRDVH
ncbi:NUDIX domain-containing protein [Streptomyces violaceorubidus]